MPLTRPRLSSKTWRGGREWRFPFRPERFAVAALTGLMLVLQAGCGGRSLSSSTPSASPAPGAPTVTAKSTSYSTQGAPFEAIASSAGAVFVSVNDGSDTGVQVFVPNGSSGLQSSCVNPLPATSLSEGAGSYNLGFSLNQTQVDGGIGVPGAIFYNASALQTCASAGVVVSQGPLMPDQGTLAVDVTPDGTYAFVSNEYGVAPGAVTRGNIGVVKLELDSDGNVTAGSTLVGQMATGGSAIAGMLLSPDGSRLYVTSEVAAPGTPASGSDNPVLARTGCTQGGGGSQINGLLTVIDVAAAENAPGPSAVLATEDAGCSPVRMAENANEATLWVAARGDNRVLAFSPARLETNPNDALLGYAPSGGNAPVGVALFHNDELLAVANSARFGGAANLAIIYVADPASAGVVQTVSTWSFPREVTVGTDDSTLYLTDFLSDRIQVISTTVRN